MTTPRCNDLAARRLRRCEDKEELLRSLPLPPGCAIAATGSLARRELTAYSDIDLILLHPRTMVPTEDEVSALWYPLWDAQEKVDYSVRTPEECGKIVLEDAAAGLALLDLRHICGEEKLSAAARQRALTAWRQQISRILDTVVDSATKRWRRAGPVVTMTRPDLKQGRGGLRDLDVIQALSLAQVADAPDLREQRGLLLAIRELLHEQVKRNRDILDPEYSADIAADLGYRSRYDLARQLAAAARDVDEALTTTLAGARALLNRRRPRLRRSATQRRPLELDVVESEGQVTLARRPRLDDPGLPLRLAASAVRYGLEIDPAAWGRLVQTPPLQDPWLKAHTQDFFAILSSPEHSLRVIKDLDRHGLWERCVPEWSRVRGILPAEPIHIHTIDEHLLVTVEHCARRSVTVGRPDLLLLAALFHDIGKGEERPHEQVGAELAAKMSAKLGFHYQDCSRVQTLVAEHTTLARLVATRDTSDQATVDLLLDAVHHDQLTLELLGVLTEADARATGPGVWTRRLERGRDELLRRGMAQLQQLHYLNPAAPMVHAPSDLGVHEDKEDGFPVLYWRGEHLRQIVRILAICAAKAWNIEAARCVRAGGGCAAELVVRPTTGSQRIDQADLLQTYRSGVHTVLPEVPPRPCAIFWHESIMEIRTPDHIGVVGEILRVLPEVEWMELKNVGETLILRAALTPPCQRAHIERDVTRALGNS